MMDRQLRVMARHLTGGPLSRMHLARLAAAAVTMAAAPLCASAAELFPYNPPASSAASPAAPSMPLEQRVVPVVPSDVLSRDELRKIDDLAAKTNRLPAAQKREVRAAVARSREDALTRRDWHQAAYYTQLLNRIQDAQ
jgi:hypothetical protein